MSEKVKKALEQRGVFEVINCTPADTKLRFTGRVRAAGAEYWKLITHSLLRRARAAEWSVDISRFYFLQDTSDGDKMFYAWRLIFQGNIAEVEDDIVNTINLSPVPATAQLNEIKLGGNRGANRNQGPRGKGAFPAGTPPLVVLQQMKGGS